MFPGPSTPETIHDRVSGECSPTSGAVEDMLSEFDARVEDGAEDCEIILLVSQNRKAVQAIRSNMLLVSSLMFSNESAYLPRCSWRVMW